MQRLLILNLFFSLFWPILNGEYTIRSLAIGLVLGLILLSIVQREYGRYLLKLASFTGFVLYAILESNARLAVTVLSNVFRTRPQVQPGIVAVPLTITNPLEMTVLASIITLTPGTLSVDIRERPDGGMDLFVHGMDIADPETFRQEIKHKFETPLLELRHLLEVLDETVPENLAAPSPEEKESQ